MIEILVVRDPDSADEIRVWQDGVELRPGDYAEFYVDAGAGWEYEDWREAAEAADEGAMYPAVRVAVAAAYADPPGKKYIDGWPEEDL